MKVTVFLNPLEYSLEAFGEKWHQGDELKGSLKIKNNSAEKINLAVVKVALCQGNYKKIKVKDAKALSIASEYILSEAVTIGPMEECIYAFKFKLPENCNITDKNGSLYLAFFDKDETTPAGHIELFIEPKIVIQQVLQILESFLRFKVKEIKYNKDLIEVKLVPPASRELSNIDGLLLSMAEIEKNLTLKYFFNLRVLNISGVTMQSEKTTKEMEQSFNSKQYLIYGDSINQDFIIESVQEVINLVKTKLL